MRCILLLAAWLLLPNAGCAGPPATPDAPTSVTTGPAGSIVFAGRSGFEPYPPGLPPRLAVRPAAEADERFFLWFPIKAAGVQSGMTVADVGCGKGRHSIEFAQLATTSGRVYCRDTNPRSIATLRDVVAESGLDNIDIAQSERGDVGLPPRSIDLAVLIDVYRYVLNQEETKDAFVDSLYAAMKPGGVVVVVHVKSVHLREPDDRESVHRRTVEDFTRHGFVAGRRLWLLEETQPGEMLEFMRPE